VFEYELVNLLAVLKNPRPPTKANTMIQTNQVIMNIFAIVFPERSFKNIPNIQKSIENSNQTAHTFKKKST
jgi:hypothetical protein